MDRALVVILINSKRKRRFVVFQQPASRRLASREIAGLTPIFAWLFNPGNLRITILRFTDGGLNRRILNATPTFSSGLSH